VIVPLPFPHFRRIKQDLGKDCFAVASPFCPITYCVLKGSFSAVPVLLFVECARNIQEVRKTYCFGCDVCAPPKSALPMFKILNSFGRPTLAQEMLKNSHRRSAARYQFALLLTDGRG